MKKEEKRKKKTKTKGLFLEIQMIM